MAKVVVYVEGERFYTENKVRKLRAHFGGSSVLTYPNASDALDALQKMEPAQRDLVEAVVGDIKMASGSGDEMLSSRAASCSGNVEGHCQVLLASMKERCPDMRAQFLVSSPLGLNNKQLIEGIDGEIHATVSHTDLVVRIAPA